MCENCGFDHPAIEEFGADYLHLKTAYNDYVDRLKTLVNEHDKPQVVSTYAIEKWLEHTIEMNMEPMLSAMVKEGADPRTATKSFAFEMMNTAFVVALLTRDTFVPQMPESAEKPSEEAVTEYINETKEQQEKHDKVASAFNADIDQDLLMKKLKEAGIELPEGTELNIVTLPDGRSGIQLEKPVEKEEETEELPGLYL